MSNQGTIRLKVTNGAPAIEKLWNGRFKLEFFCDNNSPREDWYYENVSALLPEYGILQTTNFGSGVSEDWEAIPDSVYPDMHLVLAEYPYNVRAGKHYVKLTYETLTASWVEEKDEDTDYELNGLKRVSRTFVALPATAYTKVVGTDTITVGGDTLTLGAYDIKKTDAKWELTETWLESGELSRETNSEDGKGSITITQIGGCAAAPSGYTVARESTNNNQGFETCTRTFYQDNSELSRSNDYVGSQLAESIEVFNPTSQPTPTNGTAVLGNTSSSNVDGIPTTRYTFLVPSILSQSEDKIGSQLAIAIEAFDEVPSTPSGYSLARTDVSNFEGITTNRYTFLKPSVLSRSEDYIGSQLAIVIEAFNEVPATPSGYILARTDVSDFEGIETNSYAFLKPGILSKSESQGPSEIPNSKQHIWESFSEEPTSMPGIIISEVQSDIQGVITYRYTSISNLSDGDPSIGTLSTYNESIDVKVPGVVDMFTLVVTSTNLSGATVYATMQPPTVGKFSSQVDVSIVTSASSDVPVAYNLSGVYTSMTEFNLTSTPSSVRSSGLAALYRTSIDVNQTPLPYYVRSASKWPSAPSALAGSTATPSLESSSGTTFYQNTSKTINLSGSVDTDVPTTGIYDSNVVPIFQSIDGVQYYRKTNYTLS